jgi:hypothetical protein
VENGKGGGDGRKWVGRGGGCMVMGGEGRGAW